LLILKKRVRRVKGKWGPNGLKKESGEKSKKTFLLYGDGGRGQPEQGE